MNEVVALVLVLVLATSGYAAGRLHGQFSYRRGYRFGYRQGYFDGDRASWNRRRRDLQAAVASVLSTPPEQRPIAFPTAAAHGTTYASAATEGFGLEPTVRNDEPAARGEPPQPTEDLVEVGRDAVG
jgi:hypothetical protein